MSPNFLKLQLIHKLSSNIDMIKLYNLPALHKECFYKAIEHNTDIITFLRDLGFNVYNIEIYKNKNKRGIVLYEKRKKSRYAEFEKEKEKMLYIQRRHR